MKEIKKGDIVSRKSYGNDIIFYVKEINKLVNQKRIAILKGINTRIVADAPVEDLKKLSLKEKKRCEEELTEKIYNRIKREKTQEEKRRKKIIYTGKILHLDGDKRYSEKSV